jgi:hypothetical protein
LNAHGAEAWATVFAASPPVRRIFAHDPAEHCFSEADLPALYLWRSSAESFEQLAEDWHIKRGILTLLWVFPQATQHPQRRRIPFLNGFASLLHVAVERGRDPAWRVPGDPDPTAAARGSVWPRWAGFFELALGRCKPAKLALTGAPPRVSYAAIEMQLHVAEHWQRDLAAYDRNLELELEVAGQDEHALGRHRLRS